MQGRVSQIIAKETYAYLQSELSFLQNTTGTLHTSVWNKNKIRHWYLPLITLCNKKLVMVPPSRFYDWFWIFFHRWTRIRGPNFWPRLRSRVIRDSRIFPRFSAKCSFLKKVTNIFSCGLFRSTEWPCKMILQKKKVQKVENSHFGNVLKFEILIFFQFSNILFSHFRFFRWKCDSYGIHVIMLFLEHIIAKKMPEKNWKNLENWQFYTKFTKSYICCNFLENFD